MSRCKLSCAKGSLKYKEGNAATTNFKRKNLISKFILVLYLIYDMFQRQDIFL